MFSFLYVVRELRRRLGRTVLTALGLALGTGLVVAIMGVSQGLDDAQDRVLAPLGSVGTDILVTRVVGSSTASSASPAPTASAAPGGLEVPGPGAGAGGGFFGGGGGGGRGGVGLNQADAQALLEENSNVTTDLSKLGKPGTTFTRDFFLSATLLSFPDDAVAQVATLPGVESAVGGLVQLAQHQTGKVPEIVASIQTGGQTFTQTVRPAPLTEAERAAVEACAASQRGRRSRARARRLAAPARWGEVPSTSAFPSASASSGRASRLRSRRCDSSSRHRAPTSRTSATPRPVSDPSHPEVGLVTADQLVTGRWIAPETPDEILLNV
ncbi:MAG TPA: hypothetical protein VNB94_01640, partial [Mycobacteriales bacterium]|nr:hypothetical protein [Mycobacteriales bacterium]